MEQSEHARAMRGVARIPPRVRRVHPIVFSRAAREDDDFVKHLISDRFNISWTTVLFAASVALIGLLLMLLG